MVQPVDYRLNLPNPAENVVNALKISQGVQQLQANKTAAEQAKAMQADIAALAENPTPAAISSMMVKYPNLSEPYKRVYDTLSAEQQKAKVNQATEVYAALQAGRSDLAEELVQERITAAKNSGMDAETKVNENILELIRTSPESAKTTAGLVLASAMGPEKFTETFTKLETDRRQSALEPSQMTEAQAKAQKAAVDAKFAESEAALDLQKKGWEIDKLQNDIKISKENARIAAIDAQLKRESNELKKKELEVKLEEAKRKRDEEVRTKAAEVSSARSSIDNMLNTADQILGTPVGVVEDATGPLESRLPTLSQDVADFEALMETIDAQAFMAQIPTMTGKGALSDAEGRKLSAALQNFSLKQSPKKLLANVREAQRLMLKARESLAKKYGVPQTLPDRPEVQGTPEQSEIPSADTSGFRVLGVEG